MPRELVERISPFFMYGTAWKEGDTQRCVREALRAGFRAIDTANQRKHYVEQDVGAALRDAYDANLVTRNDVFLQTKFTYRKGQDHRLPYDPEAPFAKQVEQSFASSLTHLGTDRIDAYVLHGSASRDGLIEDDWEVWRAMERLYDAGRVGVLGVSNVTLGQLKELIDGAVVRPRFVQNRCYATRNWDRTIRARCAANGIVYQGFSLLTANRAILEMTAFRDIVNRIGRTPAQVIFRFARQVGMLPLTGTTQPRHMQEDLAIADFELTPEDVAVIETIATE